LLLCSKKGDGSFATVAFFFSPCNIAKKATTLY
jgi:hypothetical protein